ncbi:EYxxD motif small membrane protein [Halobacillus sp. Marseille-Q1614]
MNFLEYLTDVGFVISVIIGTIAALLYVLIRRNRD